MKEKGYKVITAVCCVGMVVNMLQISNLKNEVQRLQNNLNNGIRNVENDISGIYRNVDNMLKKQADILSVSELEILSADTDNLTAVVQYTALPKEYAPGATQAVVNINGSDYAMEYKDGVFTTQRDIPLMKETTVNSISLIDKGTVRNQSINHSLTPRYDYLTTVYADMIHSATGKKVDGNYVWGIDGTIHINADRKGRQAEIASADLVQIVNGKEVFRQKLENTPGNTQSVTHSRQANEVKPDYNDFWTSDLFQSDIRQSFTLPQSSVIYLRVDVTDGDGLIHRCYLESWKTDSEGNDYDSQYEFNGREAAEIYNKEGKLIYTIDEKLYK